MKTKKFLSGLAFGALLGGALGLFFSPNTGKTNRAKFQKVTKQVSEALILEMNKVSKLSKKEYDLIVDRIINKYSKDDLMKKSAWEEIANELKDRWVDIQKEMKKNKKTVSKK